MLRSIAHEMYHLRQHELGLVPRKMKQHHLSPIEWQANAAAGSLLSYFAQKVGRDKIYR
jgi:Zn-dependent peptidase ImmA (M78 family)